MSCSRPAPVYHSPLSFLTALGGFLLAGCSAPPAGDGMGEGELNTPAPVAEAPGLRRVEGAWTVVSIGVKPTGDVPPIGLAIRGNDLEAHSGCVRWSWTYLPAQAGDRFEPRSGGPVCERAWSPDEQAFDRIVGAATSVRRPSDQTISIIGPEGEVSARR